MKLPTSTKPWIQGGIVGAIAAVIVGFSWGGWVNRWNRRQEFTSPRRTTRSLAL